MYSRDETVGAVLRFYQEVIRHPYLNDNALITPPPNGWDSINIHNIRGKNETVLALLRHLPYLHTEGQYDRLLIQWETVPVCYSDTQNHWSWWKEDIYPIPNHCVYLAHSVDREGASLILDTNGGTITEYSITWSDITVSWEEFDVLPEADKWKAYRTSPVIDFFDAWTRRYKSLVWMLTPNPIGQPTTGRFHTRAEHRSQEEKLVQQEQLEPWHPEDDANCDNDPNESDIDRSRREARARERKYTADIYNTYLRHGWPDHFEKEQCRVELLDLEKRYDADLSRLFDETKSDDSLSN